MAAAISSNLNDRTSLSTFRSIGSAIGGSTTGFFIPILMYTHNKSGQQVVSGNHFFWISIGCAAIAFVAYMLTCKLTTERVRVVKNEKVPASQLVKGLLANRALIILVIVDIFIVINQILAGTNMTYLFNDYFHNKQAMSVALLFTYGTVVVLAPFATKLTKLFGKGSKRICVTRFFMYVLADVFPSYNKCMGISDSFIYCYFRIWFIQFDGLGIHY